MEEDLYVSIESDDNKINTARAIYDTDAVYGWGLSMTKLSFDTLSNYVGRAISDSHLLKKVYLSNNKLTGAVVKTIIDHCELLEELDLR